MAKGIVSFSSAGTENTSDIGCWRSEVGTNFTEIGGRQSAYRKSQALDPRGDCVAAGWYLWKLRADWANQWPRRRHEPSTLGLGLGAAARKRAAARGAKRTGGVTTTLTMRGKRGGAEAPAKAAVSKCTDTTSAMPWDGDTALVGKYIGGL
ncbi:hypothetical protein LX36DRAFT_293811 [Colletotrichum falcatum]|nr:hypothetical protein LX36DRAFT_293811 [Colletotrichum falcatum]